MRKILVLLALLVFAVTAGACSGLPPGKVASPGLLPATQTPESHLVLKEQLLDPSSGPYTSPLTERTLQVPAVLMQGHQGYDGELHRQLLEANNALLQPFGYSILPGSWAIYRDGRPFHAAVWETFSPLSVSAGGDRFVLPVRIAAKLYLLTSDSGEEFLPEEFPAEVLPPEVLPHSRAAQGDSISDPVYVGDTYAFLTTQTGSGSPVIAVHLGDEIVYTNTLKGELGNLTLRLWAFDGHWAIDYRENDAAKQVARGHVVVDGDELNTLRGYEESFGFALLGGWPFYFFKKDGRFGFSYDARETLPGYEALYHFGCCDDSFFNPLYSLRGVSFFARRDGKWYHVEAYLP